MPKRACDHFKYSPFLEELVASVRQFARRFVLFVGLLAASSAAYAVVQAADLAPRWLMNEAWIVAGICAACCLALNTYVAWRMCIWNAALRRMRALESTQPPRLHGSNLQLYEHAWEMSRALLVDLPDLPFK